MSLFKYSLNNTTLSNAQRTFYEQSGYVVIRNNLDNYLVNELKQRFNDIANGKVEHGVMTIAKDPSLKKKGAKGEFLVNKLQEILYDEVLFKYFSNENVINVVEDIIGENITAAHSMLINKPPDADPDASLHPLHQDLYYFPFRPVNRIVASWTALEPVNENNGCLFVIPGSHKGKLYPHSYPKGFKNKLYHGIYELDDIEDEKVNLPMNTGDTVFFHPLLLHGSGPNRTKGFRKAISGHFAYTNCEFIDVRGTEQEEIAKEIEELSIKTFGLKANFIDIWKSKSRLVRGAPGNFQNFNSHL